MTTRTDDIRLGADIGGTFTDIALDVRGTIFSTKVLTTYSAPEQAILDGIAIVVRDAGSRLPTSASSFTARRWRRTRSSSDAAPRRRW